MNRQRLRALEKALLPENCIGELPHETIERSLKEVDTASWRDMKDAPENPGERIMLAVDDGGEDILVMEAWFEDWSYGQLPFDQRLLQPRKGSPFDLGAYWCSPGTNYRVVGKLIKWQPLPKYEV